MATISQRRKGTTYGKAYRKPLIHASFATDNLSQPIQHQSWRYGAAMDLATTVQDHTFSRDPSTLSREKTSRAVRSEQSPRINALYDPPSSDDEPPVLSNMVDGYTENKRRKLTSSSISDDELAMFDEKGLQTRTANGVTARAALKSRSTARLGVTQATPFKSKEGKAASKTTSQRLLGSTDFAREKQLIEPLKRGKGRRKEVPAPQYDSTGDQNMASTQHKRSAEDAACDHTQTYKSKESGAPRAHISYSSPPLTTPPRASSGLRSPVATTPRQRDLWNCLLPEDGRSESPGGLGLPNLQLTDSGSAPNHRKQRQQSCMSPQQRVRLIDKLTRVQGGSYLPGSHFTEDDEDWYESNSSDGLLAEHPKLESSTATDTSALTALTDVIDHEGIAPKGEINAPTITANGVPATQAGSLKKTYAQQERTFLTETLDCKPSSSQLLDASIDKAKAPKPHEVSLLASRKPSYDEEYELEVQDAQGFQGGTMRSIHELRQAGGNARLVEELESSVDELEGSANGSSRRRAALVAIVHKLQDSASCRLFTDKGMEARLVSQSDPDDDLIMKSLFTMAFLRLLTTSGSNFPPPAERAMKDVLSSLLDAELDLTRCAKRREFNMSKVALQDFIKLCTSFLRFKVWQSDKLEYLSGQLLSLQCLSSIIRRKREANDSTELLSADQVQLLAATTIPESAKLPSLNNTARKCLQLAISVLESCTLGSSAGCERSWSEDVLRRVADLLPTLDASWINDWAHLQILTLQLYLNLTNGVPRLCNTFAQTQVVDASFNIVEAFFKRSQTRGVDHGDSLLDRAILALGCLINFAEGCEAMRELVLRQRRQGQSFLQLLLDLFSENSSRVAEVYSEEESTSNVAYGYMTVLLCYLCLNKAVRGEAEGRLPGQTLTPLLDAMEEFLQYHRQIERDRGLPADFASRLQALADRLKVA